MLDADVESERVGQACAQGAGGLPRRHDLVDDLQIRDRYGTHRENPKASAKEVALEDAHAEQQQEVDESAAHKEADGGRGQSLEVLGVQVLERSLKCSGEDPNQ